MTLTIRTTDAQRKRWNLTIGETVTINYRAGSDHAATVASAAVVVDNPIAPMFDKVWVDGPQTTQRYRSRKGHGMIQGLGAYHQTSDFVFVGHRKPASPSPVAKWAQGGYDFDAMHNN